MAAQDRATDASPERSGGKADDGASRGWEGGDAWSDRLAAELSGDEDDPFGGPWGVPATPVESVDEFAQRIWREMQERQRARAAATSAEFVSARILEDEQARDAAWREAVAQGDAGARRASYEARWQRFVAAPPASIGLRDVPWILSGPQDLDAAQLRRVVLYGATDAGAQRRCIRAELVRWHPDKFQSRFGQRLAAAEAVGVLAGVVALSQSLNALAAGVAT
ncbi:NF-kappa-B inhibitor-like protein 1 [Auxenochlorella protothecoides]|uniref:NF-kappa-B inhibitor-like protein 1 n=1 Tax=Auxenochlorella protothecoides TaxID=3075 RepID=A0A087SCV0_AUXPR|nr:NF-kappa-B inhibitor-like protein 1 [Auxenochlorella protothecoides]KFM23554.1 NF-kappa-B inhibitor-like protein 1 [Auxenochlorella protothecoides]